MVKALDSTYDAGRRGGSWRKVKPVKTLDLVVLAAEWGSGRRQGWLSQPPPRRPRSRRRLRDGGQDVQGPHRRAAHLADRGVPRARGPPRRHTVFVRPELVVEIALDGVQTSTRYPGGVALRFARVKGYRPDKDPEDADLIATVQAMRVAPWRRAAPSQVALGSMRRLRSRRPEGAPSASVGVRCRRRGGPDGRLLHQRVVGRAWRLGDQSEPGAPGTLLSVAALRRPRRLPGLARGPLALDRCAGSRPCGGPCARPAGLAAAVLAGAVGGRRGPARGG